MNNIMGEEIFTFQAVNIKLQTNKTGVAKLEAYKKLIMDLSERKINSWVQENTHMVMYSATERISQQSKTSYIYGKIGKGVHFGDELVDTLNIEEAEEGITHIDKNKIWSPKITDYIFVPEIHRMAIIHGKGISINNLQRYLKEALLQVCDPNDKIIVEIMRDPLITDEILNAFKIHALDYEITYTNDDITDSADKLLDTRMKRIRAGYLALQLKADNNDSFDRTEPDELIDGGIVLAEQNGKINSAVITRKQGDDKIFLSNKEKPRFWSVETLYENFREAIVNKLKNTALKEEDEKG